MFKPNIYRRYISFVGGHGGARLTDAERYSYKPDAFTGVTIHSFRLYGGGTLLIQGDKILALELYPVFSFPLFLRRLIKK